MDYSSHFSCGALEFRWVFTCHSRVSPHRFCLIFPPPLSRHSYSDFTKLQTGRRRWPSIGLRFTFSRRDWDRIRSVELFKSSNFFDASTVGMWIRHFHHRCMKSTHPKGWSGHDADGHRPGCDLGSHDGADYWFVPPTATQQSPPTGASNPFSPASQTLPPDAFLIETPLMAPFYPNLEPYSNLFVTYSSQKGNFVISTMSFFWVLEWTFIFLDYGRRIIQTKCAFLV